MIFCIQSAAKRPGYPSGKWHPEPGLSGSLGGRARYLSQITQIRSRLLIFGVLAAISVGSVLVSGISAIRVGGPSPGLWVMSIVGVDLSLAYLAYDRKPRSRILASGLWAISVIGLAFVGFLSSGAFTGQIDSYWIGALALCTSLGISLYGLLRTGRAVEGFVISVFDDGIDRLHRVYFEDGKGNYELEFTAKSNTSTGKLQPGDSITVLLGPCQSVFSPPQLVLYPPLAPTPPGI